MKDLTTGSITRHIITLASPIAIGMLAQMAYQLIDLYFVSYLGAHATAGVNAGSNVMLIFVAATQVLGVGTVTLISQALGRKDWSDANIIFNQSIIFSVLASLITTIAMYIFSRTYFESIAADKNTIESGVVFLLWALPGFSLMFPMTQLSSILSGMGIVKPTFSAQALTVLINAILAPILISGWGTGIALGVKGAGLASTVSIALGVILLSIYFFRRRDLCVSINLKLAQPKFSQCRRILKIGLPAGGEFALMFLYTAIIFYTIRDFGVSTQAGFSVGSRVLQAIMMPAMAVSFAIAPIVGQNFGAEIGGRVRETFRSATLLGTVAMLFITVFVQINPRALVEVFNADPVAIDVAANFLQMISWNFVTQGLVFTCSGMFRGLGYTAPSLISSTIRLFSFAIPVLWLSLQMGFSIEYVWYVSIASSILQAIFSLWFLKNQFERQLNPLDDLQEFKEASSREALNC